MSNFSQCVLQADVYLLVQLTEDMSHVPLSSQQRLGFGPACQKSLHWVLLKAEQVFIPVTHRVKGFIVFGEKYVSTNIFNDCKSLNGYFFWLSISIFMPKISNHKKGKKKWRDRSKVAWCAILGKVALLLTNLHLLQEGVT